MTIDELKVKAVTDTRELKGKLPRDAKEAGDKIADAFDKSSEKSRKSLGKIDKAMSDMNKRASDMGRNIGIAIAGMFTAALASVAALGVAFFKAGRDAETFELRIGSIFQLGKDEATELFRALDAFSEDLPKTTDEIVDAFARLAAVGLKPTEEVLKNLVSTSLATTKSLDQIVSAVASVETEPLRNLGIQLDRTGKTAIVRFDGVKKILKEVPNDIGAIREAVLETFAEAFPGGIEKAKDTFETAFKTMQSMVDNFITEGGRPVVAAVTGIVNKVNEWIEANKELIAGKFIQYGESIAIMLATGFDIIVEFTGALGGMDAALRIIEQSFLAVSKIGLGFLAITQAVNRESKKSEIRGASNGWKITDPTLYGLTFGLFGKQMASPEEELREQIRLRNELIELDQKQDAVLKAVTESITAAERGFNQNRETIKGLSKDQLDLNAILDKYAGFLGASTRGQDENTDSAKKNKKEKDELAQAQGRFIEGLAKQAGELVKEKALFGATEEEIIAYNIGLLEAEAKSLGLYEALKPLIDKIKELQGEVNELELKEKLAGELQDVIEGLETESEKLGKAASKAIVTLYQGIEEGLISKDSALEKINRIVQETQKQLAEIEKKEYIERLRNSDSFIDNLKAGYLDFVDSVENNGELLSSFFADTLSTMSNNFSELFYNAITGKFDSLVDIAKSAFETILKSFIDMVTAIATREIVLKMGASLAGEAEGGGGNMIGGLGNLVGGLFSGLGESFRSFGSLVLGEWSGLTGFLGTVSASLPAIGAVVGGLFAALNIFSGLLKKTPRIDADFDEVVTDAERRVATLADFFNDDITDSLIRISVNRKSGTNEDALQEAIKAAVQSTVKTIQAVVFKLPADLAAELNEVLLNTPLDIDTVVAGERFFEFDAKGKKKLQEKLEAFLGGELLGKTLNALQPFTTALLESVGVLPEKANEFIQQKFNEFANAESREARAAVGQETLAALNAYVDAFNIVDGNINDVTSEGIRQIQLLAQELGFEGIPSIEALRGKLSELIANAELDPATVEQYKQLRELLLQIPLELSQSIQSLISQLQTVNSSLAGLGGTEVSTVPFLSDLTDTLSDFLTANGDNLSLEEREQLTNELLSATQALEAAMIQEEQARQQAALEGQRSEIEGRLSSIESENRALEQTKQLQQDKFNAEMEGLQAAIDSAREFKALAESIQGDIDALFLSGDSPFTAVEKLNRLAVQIAGLEDQLQLADTDEERIDLINRIRELSKEALPLSTEAFGLGSGQATSEFFAINERLQELLEQAQDGARSEAEIQASIERLTEENNRITAGIDSKIQANQEIASALGQELSALEQEQIELSDEQNERLRELYQLLQGEIQANLEERLEQLEEATQTVDYTLGDLGDINQNMLAVQIEQRDLISQLVDSVKGGTAAGGAGSSGGGSGGGTAAGVTNNPFSPFYVKPYAQGGWINEPVVGRGTRTGTAYSFAELGRELVLPERYIQGLAGRVKNSGRLVGGGSIEEFLIDLRISSDGSISKDMEDRIVDKLEDKVVRGVLGAKMVRRVQGAMQRRI